MKKTTLILLTILFSTLTFGQKKEHIKGTKIVTVEKKEIGDFDTLEVEDNLEIFLVKGEKNSLEIEADDNLHDAIAIDLNGTTLRLTTTKTVSSSKKFSIRVIYTDTFKTVIAKNDAIINALAEMELNDITFRTSDYSKLFLNAKIKNFALEANDKSKIELNLKSDNATIQLSKNSFLKALITSLNLKTDLYQKAQANIEGDVNDMKLRLDNNSNFTGKKLVVKNLDLTTEGYTNCSVNANTTISITASGNSEIELYNDQKIEMKKFSDNAVLTKKPTKY